MTHNRISAIDGIRGFAIFYVIALHVSQIIPAEFFSAGLKSFLLNGTFGVPLFFSISGYLVYASLKKWYESKVPYPLVAFFIRRIFRILPLWWLIVLFYYFMGLIDLSSTLAYLTFTFGLDFNSYRTIFVSWSLFVEEVFYVLLPLVYQKTQNVWMTLRFVGVLFFVAQFSHFLIPHSGTNALSYMHFFFIGILIYQIEKSNHLNDKIHKFTGNNSLLGFVDLLAIFSLAMSFWNIWISRELAVPAIFLAMMYGRGALNFIANTKSFQLFGKICFSLYLIHPLVLKYTRSMQIPVFERLNLVNSNGEIQFVVWFSIIFILSLISSYLLYKFIEKPFINLSEKLIKKLSLKF